MRPRVFQRRESTEVGAVPIAFFLLLVAGWLHRTKWHLRLRKASEHEKEPDEAKPFEPRDPAKDYNATVTYEVVGEGRFRFLLSGLRDVGNGWDRGVEMHVQYPSGRIIGVQGWLGLDTPSMRRMVAEGAGARAEEAGTYIIQWRNKPSADNDSEVIVEQAVTLEPTGPLEGWTAHHAHFGEEIMFQVDRDAPDRGLLHGFKCEILGPGGSYEADDRVKQEIPFGLPTLKGQGSFSFPNDFRDALPLRDLRDGDYKVFWVAFPAERQAPPIDVARDSFHVTRAGHVE